jgi:hypothetical protein
MDAQMHPAQVRDLLPLDQQLLPPALAQAFGIASFEEPGGPTARAPAAQDSSRLARQGSLELSQEGLAAARLEAHEVLCAQLLHHQQHPRQHSTTSGSHPAVSGSQSQQSLPSPHNTAPGNPSSSGLPPPVLPPPVLIAPGALALQPHLHAAAVAAIHQQAAVAAAAGKPLPPPPAMLGVLPPPPHAYAPFAAGPPAAAAAAGAPFAPPYLAPTLVQLYAPQMSVSGLTGGPQQTSCV